MNFITNLSSFKKNEQIYDFILIMIDHYIKMIRYFSCRKTINAFELTKIILNEIIKHYDIFQNIISNKNTVFISRF